MNYGSHVWGQKITSDVKRVMKLQDKSLRIINFAKYHDDPSKLYQTSKIFKFEDQIKFNGYFYVHDSINRTLPPSLQDQFQYLHGSHVHKNKLSTQHCVKLPKSGTVNHGIHSITGQSARAWNVFHVVIQKNLNILSRAECKKELTEHILTSY